MCAPRAVSLSQVSGGFIFPLVCFQDAPLGVPSLFQNLDSCLRIQMEVRAGEIAQWLKCILGKREHPELE